MQRRARGADWPQVRALWKECFGDSDRFLDWWEKNRWNPDYSYVSSDGDRICTSIQGWPFLLNVRGRAVDAVLLAGISTRPDCRGMGLMNKTLRFLMNDMRLRGIPAVFHTPVDPKVYFRALHYTVSDGLLLSGAAQGEAEPDPAVREGDISADFEGIRAAYSAAASRYSGMALRTAADMRRKAADYTCDGGKLKVYEKDGLITGYAFYYDLDEGVVCPECLASSDGEYEALCGALSAMAGGRKVSAKLPPDVRLGPPFAERAKARPKGSMGIADVGAVLAAVGGPEGCAVEIRDEIVPENGGIWTLNGKRADIPPCASMDAGRLAQLLCGYKSLSELAGEGNAAILDPEGAKRIDAALPKTPCWVADEY